jgi:sugar lactone lactonase YvrE
MKWGSQCDIVPGTGCIDPDGSDGPLSNGDGQFMYPRGIAVDASEGDVFISDAQNRRIQKFTSDGQFITKWGSQGTSDGEFHFPQGIAVGSNGDVYVVDTFNHRIEKFTRNGDFMTKWGSQGSDDGQLNFPADIALDSSDNLYVGDKNRRVQKFTSDGEFVTKWGSFCNLSTGSGCVDPDGQEGPLSSGDGQFLFHQGIAVDHSGNVYVADIFNNRIEVFALLSDTTPPDTAIISTIDGNSKIVINGGSSSSKLITFNFDGTDNEGIQGFKCKLDQNNIENCSSPKTYANLQDGEHTFSVLAIDTSSNEDPTPVSVSWTVDSTAPVVSVPLDITVESTSSSGAVVTYSTTAHDNSDGDVTPVCTPPSGSTFTNVNCEATDKAGNTGMASFNVIVKEPPKPAAEHTSLSLKLSPNRAVTIGQDYSMTGRLADGITGRKLVGGQDISFTSEPSGIISLPIIKTDTSGKFSLSKLKAPDKDGTYVIVAHFAGSPFLRPSDSNPILLNVEKKTTSLSLQIKGNTISGASLNGELTDLVTHKGISSQIISFTINKPDLVVHDIITDSNGKYELSLPPFECGTANIQIQSHFVGTDVFKPSDSRVSVLKIPRCTSLLQSTSPSNFDIQAVTNSSDNN